MMDRFEHLSDAQLEQFGTATTGSSGQATSSPGNVAGSSADAVGPAGNAVGPLTDAEIERHLEDCPECRTRLLQHQRLHFAPLVDPSVKSEPSPGCPSNETLQNLAAGLPVAPADPAQLVQHAAECDHCGPLLKQYTEIFSDDLSPEDVALLSQLKTSTPEWQSATVAKMQAAAGGKPQVATASARAQESVSATGQQPAKSAKPTTGSADSTGAKLFRFPSLKWVLIPAAAAACAVIAFSVWWTQRDTPEKVEKLLAQAYTEQRTMEMRWPGAAYAPLKVQRAGDGTQPLGSKSLLKAELAIREDLEKPSPSAAVLRTKGEAALLRFDFRSAIESFESAFREAPESTALLHDLALAHYQAAEYGDQQFRQEEYARALEYMSTALKQDPNNLTILFNRAILNEKLDFLSQSAADWERLLQLERDQSWRAEAERKLDEVHRRQRSFHSNISDNRAPPDAEMLPQTERNILPLLSHLDKADLAFRRASSNADQLLSLNQDPFLQDLLSSARGAQFKSAATDLARASLSNTEGRPEEAYAAAETASREFQRAASDAGIAAALFEEAYSLQFQSKPQPCIQAARASFKIAKTHQYHWLEVQSAIEQATCLNMIGRIQEAREICDTALQIASEHHFRGLYERALLLRSAIEQDTGEIAGALNDVHLGLNAYFNGGLSDVRAYSFYDLLTEVAKKSDLRYVRLAAALEQATFLDKNPNLEVVASARLNIARIALEADEPQIAEQQSQVALQLVYKLPRTTSVEWRIIEGDIGIALAQLADPKKRSSALETLLRSSSALDKIQNRLVEEDFFTALAEIYIATGNRESSERALRRAIAAAENEQMSLSSIKAALAWREHNQKPYRLLTRLLFENNQSRQALSVWEHFKTLPFLAKARNRTPFSVPYLSDYGVENGISEQPRSTATTITYALVPNGVLIWSTGPNGEFSREIAVPPNLLRRLSTRFLEECSKPKSPLSELRADANGLYEWLIAPIEQNLPPHGDIHIRPDGILEILPWEALVDNSGRYLAQQHSVVVELTFSRQPRDLIVGNDESVLVVAPPGLPGNSAEITAIRTSFKNVTVLRDFGAINEAVKRELPRYSIFHFVGHATQQADGPSLILADGLFHPSKQLTDRPTKPHAREPLLAVLSACGTAREGYDTQLPTVLVAEFLASGTSTVLASRWSVDSVSTADFMSSLYKGLQGKSLTHVLAAARTEIANKPATYHPYYWAAFGYFEDGPNQGAR